MSQLSWYRVRRDVYAVSGSDAVSFLHGQLSQDIAEMPIDQSRLSFLLQPQGKVEGMVRLVRTGEDTLVLDTDPGFGPIVVGSLARFKLRADVVFSLLDWSVVSVFGPTDSVAKTDQGDDVVAENLFGPGIGFDLLGPNPSPPDGDELSDSAYERLRIEACFPLMGIDMDDRTIPNETGLLERTVSFDKGCYRGQELVERIQSRGASRQLLATVRAPGAVVGSKLLLDDREVGTVTSATSDDQPVVALGYIRGDVDVDAGLSVG